MYIYDDKDRPYLDMSGGAAVSLLGHGHQQIITAIQTQLSRLAYVHSAFFTTDLQERLAGQLSERFPAPGAKVYFASGGSEANETAAKMAWQYWRAAGMPDKKIIISREHSYHGNTLLTLSLSGNTLRRAASAAPLIDWPRISPCYAYRGMAPDEDAEIYGLRVAGELRGAIERTGADKVAAFIAETVAGASLGAVPPTAGYLAEIRRICDEYDLLLIADEVMCGSARTGPYFAFEAEGICPDIVTLGKGISGGYQPLAAAVAGPRVASRLTAAGFTHGFTYIGHAAALAAGCAVQDVITSDALQRQIAEKGEAFRRILQQHFDSHPNVGDIRGRGLLMAVELVRERTTKAGFDEPLADALRNAAMDEGLICYPGQMQSGSGFVPHILLAPPVLVEESHMALCCERLDRVFDKLLASAR